VTPDPTETLLTPDPRWHRCGGRLSCPTTTTRSLPSWVD